MYKPVDRVPDFPSIEKRVLGHWEATSSFEKLREQNKGGAKWSFLDGPITANNPMGVHHAWGRCLKDVYQRYHAMRGKQLRYQNGFDCQGLWVEVEVEKELGFKSKREIEEYGIARFVEVCKERVRKYSKVQTDQSIRLGYWMDWDNSYFTMTEENNFTIWDFLSKCHKRGHIYKGFDSMPWCPRCAVGLSQMEMHEGYQWVDHLSVFVRFPIRGRENEALLVWTTTPWTLTSNVAAAVHPEMTYYKIRQGDWTYYVGADNWNAERSVEVEEEHASGKKRRVIKLKTLPQVLEPHGECEVAGELSGADLVGLEYDGPFDSFPAQNSPGGHPYVNPKLKDRTGVDCHRVVAWNLVTGSEGTGIVHIAPGCGREDFELSQGEGLVAVSPLDEEGRFTAKFDWLEGRFADDVAKDIVADLDKRGILVGSENYHHRYAHCWRCSTPILYRLVDEWFIDMSWRGEIIKTVPKITWIPDYAEQQELDWLQNMSDWMISKKRYWGLALPIWQCDKHAEADDGDRCEWFTVIGNRDELKKRATAGWDDFDGHSPHRPWIDGVKIKCETCGGTASRIPDVGTPWLDAGIVPYSTIGYASDRDYWQQWFPPELVLECFPGQFRNWFYALLAMNTMMQESRWADRNNGESDVPPPFRTLLGHALVRDEQGKEMHKSWGNAIEFNTAAETIGAEVMRYIYASQTPTANLNFPDIGTGRRKDILHQDQEVQRKLLTLWNCYSFYVTYAAVDGITPDALDVPLAERTELDRWIISKFQLLVRFAEKCYGEYRIHHLMERFEQFLDDLSNWYLRRSRRRFWKSESDADKIMAYATLFEVLDGICRVMAPVLPFLTEEIYQNIIAGVKPDAPVSVHLLSWPGVDESKVDEGLAARFDTIVRYRNLGLNLRNQENIKVRQPLGRIVVKPATSDEREALEADSLRVQLMEELNVKSVECIDSLEGWIDVEVRPNFKRLGQRYGKHMKGIQAHLAEADTRVVQAAVAGENGYRFDLDGEEIVLEKSDLDLRHSGPDGFAVLLDDDAFIGLETTLTPELKREGIARDFLRGVQNERKNIGLHVADKIEIRYHADPDVQAAIEEWSDYICKEALAVAMAADASLAESTGSKLKAGGTSVLVAVSLSGV